MQAEDFQRFRAVLAGMAKLYDRELDAPLLDVYWLALRDWSLLDFEQSAAHLLAHSRFMPRPVDFTEIRKAGAMTAGEAWAVAVQHARGAWRAGPAVPDVDRAVRALGGWPVLANATLQGLQYLEPRFGKAFDELQDRSEIRDALPQITGPGASWRGRVTGPTKVAELLPNIRRPA
jgi:hypothetical protein